MLAGKVWQKLKSLRRGSCHGLQDMAGDGGLSKIAIVGNPNVGKSVVFNWLTGSRVAISNYPGTTVEVVRGKAALDGRRVFLQYPQRRLR